MYPIIDPEIGLINDIAFAESHSPQQRRRRLNLDLNHNQNPWPNRRRRVCGTASSYSSPPRPTTPTHELARVQKRRNLSPKARSDETRGTDGSTRLSLTRLKQGERHQRIRHGASELLRPSDSFPGYHGEYSGGGFHVAHDRPLPSEGELRAMARLLHDIAHEIVEIYSLRNGPGSDGPARPRDAGNSTADPVSCHAIVAHKPRKAKHDAGIYCHKCYRVVTPQWRRGPDGPMTLCNVCGLVYAKRQQPMGEDLPALDPVDMS
ncbi:gata zinc finger [Colletotrichum sojae]|uniref:Gata zinc finger n=1 Tax=Colletotrichum sojae TaxID=2175907 RepID=A0A8H6MT49_9PEZI|nr:gata zinc finger [Colletotrichum sojae]